MIKWSGTTLLFGFSCYILSAQQFGGHPPSTRWRQIDTDTARIIFTEEYDSIARRTASIIHFLAANEQSLGNRLKKINIVLQNQTTIANGYVALGPYRSEFMMTPSMNNFDLGSIDWPSSLVLHEWRHVQQYNNFNTGLSRLMGGLFGEEGLALAINASVPDWFYEGDAVYNETIYSGQGRGRIPFFTNQYPSLWKAGKNYNWMKLRNNSLKHFVPSHYQLGYLLVNYGYDRYGPDFWKKVTLDAAAYKKLFYPFQSALKKYTGLDYKTFIENAFNYYEKDKYTQQGNVPGGSAETEKELSPLKTGYLTNYYFPFRLGPDSLLYLENTYRHRASFKIRGPFGEMHLRVKDISLDEHYSYRNGKIIYAAYKPDIRWAWKDYSELKVYDTHTGHQMTLTKKTKYFSPDISADGKRVVAVDFEPSGKCELHILDGESGEILNKFYDEQVSLFTGPKFTEDNRVVVCSRFRDGQMTLSLVDFAAGKIEHLLAPSYNLIGFPFYKSGKVYFTRSIEGNDEIFYVQLTDRQIFKVTEGDMSRYFASVSDDALTYSVFSANGYRLRETDLGKALKEPISAAALQKPAGRFPVAGEKDYTNVRLDLMPSRRFAVRRYNKGKGLLNFHSWRPYYEDPEFTFSLYGENILNTLQTEIYYLYNENENTHAMGFSAVFGGLFPYISAGSEYTFQRTDTLNSQTRKWNQLDTRIGLNFPLNFSGGRFFRFFNIGSSYVLRVENNTGPTRNVFAENTFSYLSHFLSYRQQVQKAVQHINPRLGVNLLLQHRHTITDFNSYQYSGETEIYLPGFYATHSIVMQAAFQQRDTFRIVFSNRIPYARGYNELHFSRMWKLGAEYHFPLWIPDWGFGNILYIQRIRAAGFYDFLKAYSRNKKATADQRSTGVELYFDTQWWNQYPLTFGLRVSRRLDLDLLTGQQATVFEFILPVSIIPK